MYYKWYVCMCVYIHVCIIICVSHIKVSYVTICDKIQISCTKSNDVFLLYNIITIEIGIIVLIIYF